MATSSPAAAAAAVDAYACKQCGAPTTFDPGATRLVCDHCGDAAAIQLASGDVPRHDMFGGEAIESLAAAQAGGAGAREIECKRCGAHAIVTRRAERCTFCDAPMVVEVDAGAKTIPPGGVLPFHIPSKQAAQNFEKWLSTRWFAPSALVARAKRDKLDGIYMPFWAFDAASTTDYDGERGTVRMSTETYKDEAGNEQTRTVEEVDWFPVMGSVAHQSTDVIVAASKTIPAQLVHKLGKWQLPKVQLFDPRFLAGFTAECYQAQPSDAFRDSYPIFEAGIRGAIDRDIGGDRQKINSMNVNWDSVDFRHLLLPVWLSAFNHGGKVFHVVINAASGEVIGERPWSIGKLALFILVIAAAITAIVLLATR